ncbi:MAG: 3-deoxy-manno-octulosonate cytidylyltransferase [candidate division FCPU426 bacterium]
MSLRVLGVIPARWGSTRFPGKPLALLAGRPMVEHVWRRAKQSKILTRLLVATEDQRIVRAVRAFGGEAVMTPATCASGTDRLAVVARRERCDVVVNIQGDEPFVNPRDLDALVKPFLTERGLRMTTLSAPFPPEELHNPARVKVVCDRAGNALYFSRSAIPFIRDPRPAGRRSDPYRLHLGFYAYRRDLLLQIARWSPTPLEKMEQLEQLRVLEHGVAIRVVAVARGTLAVDTPADLKLAERRLGASRVRGRRLGASRARGRRLAGHK